MKKATLIFCIALFSGISLNAQRLTLPFFDDFESGAIGWSTDNRIHSNTHWELGEPNIGFTIGAYSGNTCWDINLDDDYTFNANCNLISPVFDFTNVHHATISFWTKYRTEYLWDYLSVQYTVDNGLNWYYLPFPELINPSGYVNRWIQSSLTVYDLMGFSDVQFRLKFVSDGSVNYDGYSIDDFRIEMDPLSTPDLSSDPASFSFYPNPTNDFINFYFNESVTGDAVVSIIDIAGKTLIEKNVVDLVGNKLSVSSLPKGTYFIKYQSSTNYLTKRILIME